VNYQQRFHVESLLILDPINWGPAFWPKVTWQNFISLVHCHRRDPFVIISFAVCLRSMTPPHSATVRSGNHRPSSHLLLRCPGTTSTWATISDNRLPLVLPPQALHQHPAPLRPLRCRHRPPSTATAAIDLLLGCAVVGSPSR
jgi:hypothetical protein